MDIVEYLQKHAKESRAKSLANSDQLTLGELIKKLEPIAANQKEIIERYEHEAEVVFDFEYLFPIDLYSWRGSYNELALEFESSRSQKQPFKISEFLKLCKEAVGRQFDGYKGGEYTMNEGTPIWVANYGNSGSTALVDVVNNSYQVILITGLREY